MTAEGLLSDDVKCPLKALHIHHTPPFARATRLDLFWRLFQVVQGGKTTSRLLGVPLSQPGGSYTPPGASKKTFCYLDQVLLIRAPGWHHRRETVTNLVLIERPPDGGWAL